MKLNIKLIIERYGLSLFLCSLVACGGGQADSVPQASPLAVKQVETATWHWDLPAGVPEPIVPNDNPMSEAKFQLGRSLFYDTRLSANGIQSCASCHRQESAFTDNLQVSRGATGEFTPRNAQTLVNSAWRASYTWARPDLTTLEQQMMIPLFAEHPIEMGLTPQNQDAMLARLHQDAQITQQFADAFPNEKAPMTITNLIKAIASFQRGLISFESKYDQSGQGKVNLNSEELRGQQLFFSDQARCFRCHGSFNFDSQSQGLSQNLSSGSRVFQNTGLYNIDGAGGFPSPNRGLFELTGNAADMGKFRIASLRNIALTAPYMHDGSIASLEKVLDFYAAGGQVISTGVKAGDGRANPYKSALVDGIVLNERDKQDLIAFLKTLTDENLIRNPRLSDPYSAAH